MSEKNTSRSKSKKVDVQSSAETISPSRLALEKELLEALNLEVPYQAPTTLYRITSFIALIVLLLVPFAYFALIGLLAYSIWWYVELNKFSQRENEFLVYIVCVGLTCGLAIIFLLKPLFSLFKDYPGGYKPKNLRRDAEPFLFDYVDAICDAVNAPKPTVIRLDFNANASASLLHPVKSLFSNELVLTIGLPFISGLTLRQLTGVLAHEFGHFSQKAGMRINMWVYFLNRIMMHVIYVRDKMDEWLYALTSSDIRIAIVAWICIGVITISRRMLFGVCWLAEMVSSYYSRQMEFDADRYEYRLVGADTFRRTSRKLPELSLSNDFAFSRLSMHYSEGRLSDDFPSVIAHEAKQITPEIRKKLLQYTNKRIVGLFDSHPSDQDRIKKAQEGDTTGLIKFNAQQDKYPAQILFRDYKNLCKAATLELYKMNLGKKFDKKALTRSEEIISRSEEETNARKSLDRYFMTHIPDLRPIPLDESNIKMSQDPKGMYQDLVKVREQMQKLVAGYEKRAPCFETAENTLLQASEAMTLLDNDLKIDAKFFRLKKATKKVAKERYQQAKAAVDHLALKMYDFEVAASSRIQYALSLLYLPKVRERLEMDKHALKEMHDLVRAACFVSRQVNGLPPTRIFYRRIIVLFHNISGNEERLSLRDSLFEQLDKLTQQLKSMQQELGNELYPLDHKDAEMTLKQFILPFVPDWKEDGIGSLMETVDTLYNKILTLQIRLFARLAAIAEKVESALGLPPLEKPGGDNKKTDGSKK